MTQLKPGDRVILPGRLIGLPTVSGTYQGPVGIHPDWSWGLVATDDGHRFIYPVWLLTPTN